MSFESFDPAVPTTPPEEKKPARPVLGSTPREPQPLPDDVFAAGEDYLDEKHKPVDEDGPIDDPDSDDYPAGRDLSFEDEARFKKPVRLSASEGSVSAGEVKERRVKTSFGGSQFSDPKKVVPEDIRFGSTSDQIEKTEKSEEGVFKIEKVMGADKASVEDKNNKNNPEDETVPEPEGGPVSPNPDSEPVPPSPNPDDEPLPPTPEPKTPPTPDDEPVVPPSPKPKGSTATPPPVKTSAPKPKDAAVPPVPAPDVKKSLVSKEELDLLIEAARSKGETEAVKALTKAKDELFVEGNEEDTDSEPEDEPVLPTPKARSPRPYVDIPPPPFERTPPRKPWMGDAGDARMVMGEDKSLRGKIDAANWASEKAINFDELGMEKGWTRSLLEKLRIKSGWSADVVNSVRLHTVGKIGMFFGNFINNRLIRRKTGEIARLDRKIQREGGNPLIDPLAKENLARLNESIEWAKNSGNTNMVRVLTERRDEMVERGTNRSEELKMERDSLANQLGRYNERKIAIIDSFVGSVEMQTEKVRNQTGYHENVKKRQTMHVEMERMLDVMSQTENQIINLKKSLAFTKDSNDRWAIKDSIRELKRDIKESKWKHMKYQRMSYRLGQFIELTDKRTQRFDNLKFRYLRQRNSTQERIDSNGNTNVEAPAPQKKKKKERGAKTTSAGGDESGGDTIPEGTFDAGSTEAGEAEPGLETKTEPEAKPEGEPSDPEKERRLGKIKILKNKLKEFNNILGAESESSLLSDLIVKQAGELSIILLNGEKDDDFNDAEHKVFKDGGKQLGDFILQIKNDGGILKKEIKESFIKDFNLLGKLKKLK